MNLNLPTEHVTAVCTRLRHYREQNGYTATEFAGKRSICAWILG